MQYSIENLNQIVGDFRIDAEAYLPIYIEIEKKIKAKKFTTIDNETIFFKKGIFDIKADCYCNKSNSAVPFVRISNLKNMTIDENDIIYIPKFENDKNLSTYLNKNDLILSKTAYPACSLVTLNNCNTSQDTIAVKLKKNSQLISHYLVLFLNSKYGYHQMKRWFTGNIQMHLNLTDGKGIIIPILDEKFQLLVKLLFEKSINYSEYSKNLYTQSEESLLKELELLDWQPKHNLWTVKNFSETQNTERMDAEYYQPKYDEIINKIKTYRYGYNPLGAICLLIGHPSNPPYANNEEKVKTFIITQKHLGDLFPNENFWEDEDALYTTEEFIKNNSKYLLQNDDILLYSVGAYIGKTNIYNSNKKATLASFLTLLRPNKSRINPYYLLVYLNSLIGKEYTRRFQRGMAQQYIYPFDIKTFLIPNLEKEIQKQIELNIRKSNKLKYQSKQLLEIAKIGVEKAIEENEEIATKWINQELDKIGVSL